MKKLRYYHVFELFRFNGEGVPGETARGFADRNINVGYKKMQDIINAEMQGE